MQMFSGEVSPHPISARPPHVVRSPYPMLVNTGRRRPSLPRSGAWCRRPPAPRVGPGGTAPACLPLFWILYSTLIKRSRTVREMGAALEAVKRSGWLGSGWQGPYQRCAPPRWWKGGCYSCPPSPPRWRWLPSPTPPPPSPHLDRSSTEAGELHRGATTSQRRAPWPR